MEQGSTRRDYIILSTHIVSFFILFYTKCGTSLYGIGGSSLENHYRRSDNDEALGFERGQLNDINKNHKKTNDDNNASLCYNVNYLS